MAEGLWKDLALPGGEVRSDGLSVPNVEGRAWPSPPPGHDAGTWATCGSGVMDIRDEHNCELL